MQNLYLDGKKDEAAAALPAELIDTVPSVGPKERIGERLAAWREAGRRHADRHADGVRRRGRRVDHADDGRARGLSAPAQASGAASCSRRSAIPGHAFPAIALGRELVARGHEVCLQTWAEWREHVEREGMALRGRARVRGVPARGRVADG